MTEPRCTLVPIDFSPSSLAALDYALLLASKEPASVVRVVYAVPLPTIPIGPGEILFTADLDQRVRAEADRMLRELVEKRRSPGVQLQTQLLAGPAPSAILEDAATHACRRIVVGTSRPGPFARVLLGSVADRVMRTSTTDVIVVPPPSDPRPRDRIRNVVCATDFSASAETALLHALEIVRAHDARLHLFHAWEPAPYIAGMPSLATSIHAELTRELEEAAHRHEAPGVPILRELRRGHPPSELGKLALEIEADLVVVGTTGKRGMDHLLLGSFAERVARTSPVPVCVARSGRGR